MLLFVTLAWLFSVSVPSQSPAPDCATVDACRAQALIAEAAGDFEQFHDLAWRAVQKGKANNPELMVMLARAMALSGRPGDAIVMLSRLADMGVKVDASGDEFRVVRTLKDWPDVEAKLAALTSPAVTDAAPPSKSAAAHDPAAAAARPSRPQPREAESKASAPKLTREVRSPETREPKNPAREPETPVLSFSAPASATSGLGYDAVSRRFVVSDRAAGRLMVIDEVSQHVVPLVSAAGAGFYADVTAFRIDSRRGDLWVVSARNEDDHAESVVHKLQLVSGRPIFAIKPASFGDVRLVDVAVDDSGTVYVLDAADSRIFRVRPGARTLELVTRTKIDQPTAFDVVDDRTAFVAGSAGLMRVDLGTGHVTHVESKTSFGAIASVNVHGQSVFVLQQSSDGSQLVRCKLDRTGRAIKSIDVVDSASAIGRGGEKLYYLAAPGVIKSIREQP
jgi:hypothetical protein